MATVPEITVVQMPTRDAEIPADAIGSVHTWAPVEVPHGERPTPIVLAVLGTIAGIGAMALGALAVLAAGGSSGKDAPAPTATVAAPPATSPEPGVEARVLSLLAKPSTERVVFRGSGGRLVLAVGSAGRAAILLRGLERATAGKPYYAWIVAPGGVPVRTARFRGTERAVFLSRPVGPRASVVVSTDRPAVGRPGPPLVIAARG